MSFGLAASPRVNAVLTASDKTNKARGPRAAIPAVVLLHAAGEQEDFRPLFLPGPPALVLWSGAVPRGLSQSNVRQNATVCIRGEPLSAGSPAGRGFQRRGPRAGARGGGVSAPAPGGGLGTACFGAARHVLGGEGGPRRQAGPAARGQ